MSRESVFANMGTVIIIIVIIIIFSLETLQGSEALEDQLE